MTISTTYRAEVEVPEDVFQEFGHTSEYAQRSMTIYAQSRVAASGQDRYAAIYEWGEDSDLECVRNFHAAWEAYIAELQARLPVTE